MSERKVTLGADPELFLISSATGEYVPAYGLIGGTKTKPLALPGKPRGFFYQEDGAAFEFNIPEATTASSFTDRIQYAIQKSQQVLATSGLVLDLKNCAAELTLTPAQLQHPFANMIGCSPDWDGFTNTQRHGIGAGLMGNKRFAGGHLHIGYDTSLMPRHVMAQHIDLLVYMPLSGYDAGLRSDRASLYGVPGVYRPKPYGIEYRRPSSFWLNNPILATGLARLTFAVVARLLENIALTAKRYETWNLPRLQQLSSEGRAYEIRGELSDWDACHRCADEVLQYVAAYQAKSRALGDAAWA